MNIDVKSLLTVISLFDAQPYCMLLIRRFCKVGNLVPVRVPGQKYLAKMPYWKRRILDIRSLHKPCGHGLETDVKYIWKRAMSMSCDSWHRCGFPTSFATRLVYGLRAMRSRDLPKLYGKMHCIMVSEYHLLPWLLVLILNTNEQVFMVPCPCD